MKSKIPVTQLVKAIADYNAQMYEILTKSFGDKEKELRELAFERLKLKLAPWMELTK